MEQVPRLRYLLHKVNKFRSRRLSKQCNSRALRQLDHSQQEVEEVVEAAIEADIRIINKERSKRKVQQCRVVELPLLRSSNTLET